LTATPQMATESPSSTRVALRAPHDGRLARVPLEASETMSMGIDQLITQPRSPRWIPRFRPSS